LDWEVGEIISHGSPVRLAYQPPDSSTFLSQQTSHQHPANNTHLSEQTSTSQWNRKHEDGRAEHGQQLGCLLAGAAALARSAATSLPS
jgi:hypothetical protein